ncbi:Nrap protein [Trametes gibbosa]|nr:Nrap protein [Trametes gibbosa]
MAQDLKRKRGVLQVTPKAKRVHVDSDIKRDTACELSADEGMASVGSSSGPEEDDWVRVTDVPQSHHEHTAVRAGSHLLKPPIGGELRKIKDATDLYRSTSFKLQIDALLPNVRPKYKQSQPLDDLLISIHKVLATLPSIPPQHPLHASRSLSEEGIKVPYVHPLPTDEANWKVAFERPSEILVVGSWVTKTAVKANDSIKYAVDLALEIPSNLLQEKDYLNGRAFQKRAYYLAVVASAMARDKSLACNVYYGSTLGDPRHTSIVLLPRSGLGKLDVQIRIIVYVGQSSISLQRLSPARSNIRTTTTNEDSQEEPTLLYNTAFMLMTTPRVHLLHVHDLLQSVPGFADALTLLRVWANQRGYGLGNRMCVRGFEGKGMLWISILDLIINGEEPQPAGMGKASQKRKPLGKGLSSYQLFKAALDFLARHKFSAEPVFVKSAAGHRFPPSSYSIHGAVFVDATSSVNLLADVPLSSLDLLAYDAQATLDALNHSILSEDPFQTLFLKDHRDLFGRFDLVARVDIACANTKAPSVHRVADHGSLYNMMLSMLITIVRQGLGNRAKAITILHASSDVRPTSQAHPSQPPVVYIGVVLDCDHAFRLVDHGPAAEEQESVRTKQFRDLWGDKAELRRFKDGSISESVVWNIKDSDERAQIPSMIIRHLLAWHLGIAGDAVETWQTQFDGLLKLPESVTSLYQCAGSLVGFKSALSAFDTLVRQIKALDDQLPLAVLSVSPASPGLRYTDVFVPVAVAPSARSMLPKSASYLPAMEIVIEFEKSGRWPDDLKAIQKMKLAFFERLASILMSAVKGLQANVVLGERAERLEIEDEAALEIVTPDGWAFRAHILHDREATLLDRIVNDQPHLPKALRQNGTNPHERHIALHAREVHVRRFIQGPRHHRAIAALCHKYAAFAGTIRLTKRWFASHWLLRGHVSEEAVELLCAYVFLRATLPLAGGAASNRKSLEPGSKERGFAQVVDFLKDWDWAEGLVVPLDTMEAYSDSTQPIPGVAASKDVAWSLRTPFDAVGHTWTSSGPSAVVARRVTSLAHATWAAFRRLEMGTSSVKRMFHHPVDKYDFIIELNPALSTRTHQLVDADPSTWTSKGKYANAILNVSATPVMPVFDPLAMFYDDLVSMYADTVLLFFDPHGGNRIGAVWQPNLRDTRPFRVLGGFSSIPSAAKGKEKDKGLVVLNEDALYEEIRRVGGALVARIVPR